MPSEELQPINPPSIYDHGWKAGAAWIPSELKCNATTAQIYGTGIGPQNPSCPIIQSNGAYVATPGGTCYCNGWYVSKGKWCATNLLATWLVQRGLHAADATTYFFQT